MIFRTFLFLVLVPGGCTKIAPLDEKVTATSDFNFMMWKADVAGDFTLQEWHDFDEALQDINLDSAVKTRSTQSSRVEKTAFWPQRWSPAK